MTEAPHANSKFLQQRLPACRPLLTPFISIIFYICVCVISLGLGLGYYFANNDIWELVIRYDNQCDIGQETCELEFDVDKDINDREIFVYYELDKVYQDNFMFTSSKSWGQLEGKHETGKKLKKCDPIKENENGPIAPCGTVPLSIFNDTYTFSEGFPDFTEKGVAIPSVLKIYKDTNGEYSNENAWLRDNPMFPGGQRNERFINWIQTATFPKFRKLWGRTEGKVSIKKGHYSVFINNNYPVASFKGKKSLVITETTFAGGKSMFLAWFFIAICIASAVIAIIVFILNIFNCFPLYRSIARPTNSASQ